MLNTFAFFIPIFLLLVAIEAVISFARKDGKYSVGNTAINFTIGAIDQIGSLFYFAVFFFVLQYMYDHFKLVDMPLDWRQWVLAYLAVDLLSYWYHRLSHRVSILWAGHITHHSSELFNLSNGFRTSLFQGINRIVFWACLPMLGFSPYVLIIIFKISGLYDFFMHTEYVPRLPLLEKIFITPSLHRVHHGKNKIYIDKNYGSTFSIWDRLFGTYQAETEKVVYGITSPAIGVNPIEAINHYYILLWRNITHVSQWYKKVMVLFSPPELLVQPVAVERKSEPEKSLHENKSLRTYAYWQMMFCITGFICLLAYIDYLSHFELVLSFAVVVVSMIYSTLIFNNQVYAQFPIRFFVWQVIAATLMFIFIEQFHQITFLLVFAFVSFSLVWLSFSDSAKNLRNIT
ncbi:MAG: sterol desaturase family protein [Bacteroidetes bacterium]|nr:sterol desaturase family protein [Bacteroidota bacterium]